MKVFFIGFSANYVVLLMEVKKGPYPICMRNLIVWRSLMIAKLRCLQKQITQTARQELLQQPVVNSQFNQNDHSASIGRRSNYQINTEEKHQARKKKLKRNIKQEDVARIIFNEDRLCPSLPLSKTLNALNIYQLNIYQNLSFVPRLKSNIILKIFTELIKKPKHKSPTVSKTQVSKFSKSSYIWKPFSLCNFKYCITVWGTKLCHEFLQSKEKEIQS